MPQLKNIPYLLIPIALIISGIFLLKKKQRKLLGITLNVIGILFLFQFFPFSSSRYNPFFGYKNYLPYQDLINYVDKKGGLVFWSQPEVTEETSEGRRFLTINFYTPSYPESLIMTSGYAGFGVNMALGIDHIILAQGEWDKVLIGYCEGKRSQPVWVIGEVAYHGSGLIDSTQDIFFLPKLSYESVYEALRRGRFYVRYYLENNINISLSDFYIEDPQDKDKFAFMGDEIEIKGKSKLHIKGNYTINPPQDLRIELIRNGRVIKEFEFSNEGIFDLEFQDDSPEALHKKSYYRLNFFAGNGIILVTNSIFVEVKDG